MSDIAKELFNQNPSKYMDGESTINELGEMYGLDGDFHAFFMILNSNHADYDDKLNTLELEYEMFSAGYEDTSSGFLKEGGEVSRIGMFQSNFTVDQIHSILGEVVFDVYQIK
jgi:hypothetical protein